MFFDDRLATVLRQRTQSEAGLRTQFRQLLDLLGKDRVGQGGRPDHSLMAAAWLRMDALAASIPPADRARMIRETGWRFRSADLAYHLADQEPEVASAALLRADLSVADWTALIPRLPVRARGFLRLRRDLPVDVEALLARLGVHDRGLPAPAGYASDAVASPPQDAARAPVTLRPVSAGPRPTNRDDDGRSEISKIVDKIANFRREREERSDPESSPRLPLGEVAERADRQLSGFAFAADAAGRIEWAVAEAAPMIIGARLFAPPRLGETDPREAAIERAFARRQPIAEASVTLRGAPAITGEWTLDAQPHFHRDGHFTGYVGRFRRAASSHASSHDRRELQEADRIRQLLHELRTPVTAVQGYAEIIQQQLYGPVPHEYRALAAAIAADAARILAGFDELDRLARLETGVQAIEAGECDLAAIIRRIADQLAAVLALRNAAISVDIADDMSIPLAIDKDEGEALVWRLLASLAAMCDAGEAIAIACDRGGKQSAVRLTCTLPARLASQDNLFAATTRPANDAINAGLFGAGFALRLARAEAVAAGGALTHEVDRVVMTLPLAASAAAPGGYAHPAANS